MHIPIRCWLLFCACLALSTCYRQDTNNDGPAAGNESASPNATTTAEVTTAGTTTTGETKGTHETSATTARETTADIITTEATTTGKTTTGGTKGTHETSATTADQTSITRITGSAATASPTTKGAAGNVTSETTDHRQSTAGHTSAHTSGMTSTKKAPMTNGRKFDVASFFGGILLVLGLVAIVFFAYQCYQKRKGASYSRLEA